MRAAVQENVKMYPGQISSKTDMVNEIFLEGVSARRRGRPCLPRGGPLDRQNLQPVQPSREDEPEI